MAQGTTKGVPIDIDGTLSNNSDLLVASQKATKTYVDNGLLLKQNTIGYTPVNKGGDTMLGNLILNANPTTALQAATKDYVDTLINGIDWKQSANAATVSALPTYAVTGSGQILTGTTNGAIPSATTDGVTLVAGNRVLVKNETSTLAPNNGIYVVTQAGSVSLPFILTRSDDANTSAELSEATLSVSGGSTLSNSQWHCNPASVPVVIGTTNITFAQIGSGTYTASAPISITGNVISIPQATTSVNGYLSSTDWTTFNLKESALTFSSPLSRSVNTISIPAATSSVNGYLTSTDWTTFNSKQGTITLTTTGSSGASTFVSNTLNIPTYTLAGLGGISLTSLSSTATGLTYTNTTGVFSLTSGYVIPTTSSATNWDTAYTNRITSLTTTGSSGAATLSSNTLNIPNYTLSGLGGQPLSTNLTSLSGLSYVSASFVKMTAAGTFSLDTNTYLTANQSITLSGAVTGTGTTAITTALSNSVVGVSNLSATGTPSSTTYLRGDNTWATVSGSMAIGGTITSATAGSILFAGTSGVLQQDNAAFFWDDTNNRLGIGTASPSYTFDIPAHTTSSIQHRVGTFQVQSYALNNGFMSDNMYYGGTAWTRTTTGYGYGFQFYNGQVLFHGVATGTGNFTQNIKFKVDYDGAVVIGNNISSALANYSGATALFTKNGRLLLGTTTESTYIFDVVGTSRLTGQLTVTGSTTAATAIARGAYYTPTLVAAANGDVLIGIDVAPTFTLGAFTGTSSYAARFQDNLLISKNQNAGTVITVSNTTSGTSSEVNFTAISDASSGSVQFGKYSTTKTAYKIVSSKDCYFYNNTVGGDISFLNDFATGVIKFAAGASSTAHVTIGTTGLTTFATGVDYKRLNPTTVTVTSTATLTPDISAGDTFTITAQAVALSVANPTGTPINGQKMTIRIKDNATARAITWSGTQYRASSDLPLPTTTIISKTMYLGFIYNSTDTKWDLIAFINNF